MKSLVCTFLSLVLVTGFLVTFLGGGFYTYRRIILSRYEVHLRYYEDIIVIPRTLAESITCTNPRHMAVSAHEKYAHCVKAAWDASRDPETLAWERALVEAWKPWEQLKELWGSLRTTLIVVGLSLFLGAIAFLLVLACVATVYLFRSSPWVMMPSPYKRHSEPVPGNKIVEI